MPNAAANKLRMWFTHPEHIRPSAMEATLDEALILARRQAMQDVKRAVNALYDAHQDDQDLTGDMAVAEYYDQLSDEVTEVIDRLLDPERGT